MNELSRESSPYLLQHAQNAVHWKAWNDAALQNARYENKLLLISVGYSACHWCHVMEHESFEDQEVADIMNAHFISIKVDREERPDIDAVYMKAVQLMTGQGGWPMNVIALPDGRPVWGGTYFRKQEWIQSLAQLASIYKSHPAKMIEYAEKLHDGLKTISLIPKPEASSDPDILQNLIETWKKSFDHDFGGMARAPKFMMPNNYKFLMHYGYQNRDQELLDFVDLTLTRMAYGGLFDTIGGGFSRYSVDMEWHVPHFEKMLYDNGQLISLYADAFKRTGNSLYRDVIEKTLGFISRELTAPNGAFMSALDADSLNGEGRLEEGSYYVWTKQELSSILGNDFDAFSAVFNINDFGHWEHGNYVLIQTESLEEIAHKLGIALPDLISKKKYWEQILFTARQNRSYSRRDDKCLTSWNAIMLKGCIDAYKALQHPEYLGAALRNADFLCTKQWSETGNLWHSFKEGISTINGYLEDYVHVIAAFISLHEITMDDSWIYKSRQLTDYCFDHFFDAQNGFFRFTSRLDPDLVATHFETEDNVIPASNSVMAYNLRRLGTYFENAHYTDISDQMLSTIIPNIEYPSAFSNWLSLLLENQSGIELAICGSDAKAIAQKINIHYFPHLMLAGTITPARLPFLDNRFLAGANELYVCQNRVCLLPTNDIEAALKEISGSI